MNPDPLDANSRRGRSLRVAGGRWGRSAADGSLSEPLAVGDVAVLVCCTALGPPPRRSVIPERSGIRSACWGATVYRFVTTEAGVEHTFAAGQSG
jgi:hypothetical protein